MKDIVADKKNIAQRVLRIVAIVAAILLIPLIGMQINNSVNWSARDFILMGSVLAFFGLIYEFGLKRLNNKDLRFIAIIIVVGLFFYLWAELAVGIFTNWGS